MDSSIIYRFLLVLLIFSSSQVNAIEFKGKFIQGHFILGKTNPNAKIIVGKKEVKISKDGFFFFFIDKENLKSRKNVSTNTLLIHGDSDQVVPPHFMLEAKDFFLRHNVEIESHLIKNCDHHIPIEASSIALSFIKKNLVNA